MTRRRKLALAAIAVALLLLGPVVYRWAKFPPDTSPEGAYQRIASSVAGSEPEECFAYLEQEAQHAVFTIQDYHRKAAERITKSYPPAERQPALVPYLEARDSPDPPALWARIAHRRGWLGKLRRDLSGVDHVEQVGERATVVTVRGTRYPFRRRPNGIWGLTLFTAELEADAAHAARDWALIQRAAKDYEAAVHR